MDNSLLTPLPVCSVFGRCGGCQHQDISYEDELRLKDNKVRRLLQDALALPEAVFLPIVASPRAHNYRNRLDLKLLKRKNGSVHIGFSPAMPGPVVEMMECPLAMERISDFIPRLRQEATIKLPSKYKMANLVVRCGDGNEVRWGGIGRRSTRLSDKEYLFTEIGGKKVFYSLDTFFQANLSILPLLRESLRSLPIWGSEAVFYDLYGGVGLFSLMVNDQVLKVVNIEENPQAVRLARWNMMQNRIANMDIIEGKVEDSLPNLIKAERADNNIVMVDPPRAGLSQSSLALLRDISRTRHLLYLSCDPESLVRDLKGLLTGNWHISSVRPFDFFPRTRHLETLVHLAR